MDHLYHLSHILENNHLLITLFILSYINLLFTKFGKCYLNSF